MAFLYFTLEFFYHQVYFCRYNILSLAVLIYLALKVLRFFKGEGIKESNSRFVEAKLLFYSGLLVCSMIVILSPLRYQGFGYSINYEYEMRVIEIFSRIFPFVLFIYSTSSLFFAQVLGGKTMYLLDCKKTKRFDKESSKENGFNLTKDWFFY